jgi:polypeptide N-acetylgalactosaminyltransferase
MSWRSDDHISNDIDDDDFTVMAMSAANTNYKIIQETGNNYIKNQNRAPDTRYNINVTFSDLTSLDRIITDTRPEICRHFRYNLEKFPKVSVIIPFYNEATSMLLRTVHSILNRTPEKLLEEIVMVDDKSTDPWLAEKLDEYLQLLPKVKLVRNSHRVGLIVSRMTGARLSKGSVLFFLDAHSEVNVGWLPPLLDEIQRHPNAVYQPFVDGIDAMTLAYESPTIYHKGAFNWELK